MAESVHKVIEFVGISAESWEKAAAAAVELAPGKAYVICGLARSPNSMCRLQMGRWNCIAPKSKCPSSMTRAAKGPRFDPLLKRTPRAVAALGAGRWESGSATLR